MGHDAFPGTDGASVRADWRIRPATGEDVAEICQIEREIFPDPWPVDMFVRELSNPLTRSLVALDRRSTVAGYCFYRLGVGDAEIHTIAVAAGSRRRGIGRRLLHHALIQLSADGVGRVMLEVRIGNAAARGLYRSFGFTEDAVRKRYYRNGEDAILMSLTLPEE